MTTCGRVVMVSGPSARCRPRAAFTVAVDTCQTTVWSQQVMISEIPESTVSCRRMVVHLLAGNVSNWMSR